MIKQPDVLMFCFLYRSEFSREVLKANYEYYEPKTIHESSLSPSVHSVLACDLKKIDEAQKFFGFATRLDLDNYNRNTREGLHTTSIAAAWINIVFGFGGLRSDPDLQENLSIAPVLPSTWKSYTFRFVYEGSLVCVKVCGNEVIVNVAEGEPVNLNVYNKNYKISEVPLSIPMETEASV
jgi:maltose phosphorylase